MFKIAKHFTHRSGSTQNDVHGLGTDRKLTIAQLVEQALGQVTQGDEFGGIEKSRPALDGMKATENVVEQTAVVGRTLQVDKLVVHPGQKIPGFDEEILQQVFHSPELTHDFPAP